MKAGLTRRKNPEHVRRYRERSWVQMMNFYSWAG